MRQKIIVFSALTVMVTLLYFGTLHSSVFSATPVPMTGLDRSIPFAAAFIVPYLSFFLLILMPLWVVGDPQELWDVAFGFSLIVVFSSLVFLFWPTMIPTDNTNPLLRSFFAVDGERNACPSLHASLALYCALIMQRHLRAGVVLGGIRIWTLLVIASPLLIKRHAAVDLAAGALLAVVVFVVLFRPLASNGADSEPVLETLRIRNRLGREAPELITLARHDTGKRATELGIFLTLAATGFLLSIWARSHANPLILVPGILVTAVALNTFPLLMHEGMHGVLFRNRQWNWMISVLLGSTFLMSFTSYRVLHIRHHRYLGDPRDPDDYHNYSRSRAMVWFLHFVRLTAGPILYVFLIPLLALKYGSRTERKLICIEYTILFTIYSVILRLFPARELMVVWFVPLVIMGMFVAIRGFTQHGITDASDPYLASRTMLPNRVVAFLLLNENYHLEHHLFPEVPSYHLAGLHRLIWPKLPRAVAGRSYLEFLGAFLRATPRMDETPIGLVTPHAVSPGDRPS